jgi:hypothetical protein
MSDVSIETPAPTDDTASDDTVDDAPRSRPSLGPVIALGLAAALVIGALAVALIGGDDVSPVALTVNGSRTTSATLDSELEGFAGSTYFQEQYAQSSNPQVFSAGNGSLNALATAQWLSFRTQTMLAERILDQRGASLTPAQVNTTKQMLAEQDVTKGMSSGSAEQLARFAASSDALANELGSYDAYRAAMQREAKRLKIVLDPKYGRWNDRSLAFCSPLGCEFGGATVVPREQTDSSGG